MLTILRPCAPALALARLAGDVSGVCEGMHMRVLVLAGLDGAAGARPSRLVFDSGHALEAYRPAHPPIVSP